MEVMLSQILKEMERMHREFAQRHQQRNFFSLEGFVVQHGKECVAQALPKNFRKGTPKQCFHNSFALAKRRGLIYVEGYATGEDVCNLPIHHAWCVHPGSNLVIDPTTSALTEYIGVSFKIERVIAHHKRHGEINGSLIDNWSEKWPLLSMSEEELLAHGVIL